MNHVAEGSCSGDADDLPVWLADGNLLRLCRAWGLYGARLPVIRIVRILSRLGFRGAGLGCRV